MSFVWRDEKVSLIVCDDGADGPDAVASITPSTPESVIMPMYASSPDGSATAEVRDQDGNWRAQGTGSTPSLTLNPMFGTLDDGDQPTGIRVTNSSGAAADDSAFVRAFEIIVD